MRKHDLTILFAFWQFLQFLTILTIEKTVLKTCLWHLRHWLQFWQLRTWIHDNHCYLTINFDTGQHSQFLRCFLGRASFYRLASPPPPSESLFTLFHLVCKFDWGQWNNHLANGFNFLNQIFNKKQKRLRKKLKFRDGNIWECERESAWEEWESTESDVLVHQLSSAS